ncbi:methylenetetrahydrofolate reductase [Patescibacteria group bacterium]
MPSSNGNLGNFFSHLKGPNFTISVQIDPRSDIDSEAVAGVLSEIYQLGEIQAVDVNARCSQVAWDSVLTSCAIQNRGFNAIPHVTCRDASFGGVMNQVLAAVTHFRLQTVLVIRGDDPRPEFRRCGHGGKGVFQGGTVKLVQALDDLRLGRHVPDLLIPRVRFAIGVAFDQNAENIKRERRRLAYKRDARANFVMSQPVFNLDQVKLLQAGLKGIWDRPVMVGIWPLQSREQAVELNANLGGVVIPDSVIGQMPAVNGGGPEAEEHAKAVGRKLARELLDHIRDNRLFNGAYIISPNRKPRESLKMLNGV